MGSKQSKTTLSSQINLNSIRFKQNILFYGFVRIQIFSQFKQHQRIQIPIDIVNLCLAFYQINLKHLSLKQSDQHSLNQTIYNLATECKRNQEYFICYELCKALININDLNQEMRTKINYYMSSIIAMRTDGRGL